MFFQPLPAVVILASFIFLFAAFKFWKNSSKQSRIQWGLRGVAALLLLTAGLRPSMATLAPAETYNSRYDVYFVVDLTSSMVAEDWDGDKPRLEGIREDINDLLDDYVGAKFSLITFNSSATLRVPLTPDSTAVASSINTMLPEITMYSKGSSISTPVKALEKVLAEDNKNSADKNRANIVLYFGDGEQTSKEEPTSFSSLKGLTSSAKVYGYGTDAGGKMKNQTGLYISDQKEEYIKDSAGQEGYSKIDEENLKTIATELGGKYEHRSADQRISAATLNDEQKINLDKNEGSSIKNTAEFYWVLLIPFMLIMFVEAGMFFRSSKMLGVKRK